MNRDISQFNWPKATNVMSHIGLNPENGRLSNNV